MSKCKITGQGVFLRPLVPKDLPWIVKWSQDEEINFFTDGGYPQTREEALPWFEKLSANRQARAMAICLLDGTPIGSLALVQISWRTGEAEVGLN